MIRRLLIAIAWLAASGLCAAAPIKIATVAPEGSGWMREMRASGAAIKARTEGRVELKFYPAGVMGNDSAVLRKIKLGQLQGGAFTGGEASLVYPDAPIYGLPFLFRDAAEVAPVRAAVDPLLRANFEKHGFVVAGISGGGFAYFMSTAPIRSVEDLGQRKVWIPQNDRISTVAMEVAGVSPVSLPLTDVYPGLSTGLIDTVANTTAGAIFFQWHTRVKYVVDLPLTFVMGYLLIDKRTMDKLAPGDREAVVEEIGKAFTKIDATVAQENEAARATLSRNGIEFVAPTEPERYRRIGEETLKRLEAEKAFTPEVLSAIQAALAKHRGG